MSKPYIHAESSAKRFGGKVEDYEPIHAFLDSSKGTICSNVHRTLTHNAWFLSNVLERIWFPNSCPMTSDGRFPYIINSVGKKVSVREIGEQHIYEDFDKKFIPTAQDYLENIIYKEWMNNGRGNPPSSFAPVKTLKKDVIPSRTPEFRRKQFPQEPPDTFDIKTTIID